MLLTIEFHEDFPGPYINYFPFLFFLSYVGGGAMGDKAMFFFSSRSCALGFLRDLLSPFFSPSLFG